MLEVCWQCLHTLFNLSINQSVKQPDSEVIGKMAQWWFPCLCPLHYEHILFTCSVCIKSLLLHSVALGCNCWGDIQPPCSVGSIFGASEMLFVSMLSLIKQLFLSNNGVQISFLHTSFAPGVYIHSATACDQRAHSQSPINPQSFAPGHGCLLNSVSLGKSHECVKMTDKRQAERQACRLQKPSSYFTHQMGKRAGVTC